MRSQIRNRLFTQAQVEIAQSRIYQPDQSIIHQLQDLIDHDYQSNEHKYLTDRKPSKTIGLYSTPSHSTLLNLRTKNEGLKQFHIDKTLHSYQSRKRYQVIRNSEQLTTRPYLPNNMDLMDKERKKPQKQGQVLEQKKQGEMTNLKIKFNNSRSTLIKNKQVLKKSILPKCNKCGQILSEVYRNNVVCRNRKCRILTLYEDIETYPIFGIFYDIENPSCSCEELEDVVRRIKQEVLRIQKYRDQLIQLQYYMDNIIESKRKFQPNNKNELRHILTSVTEIKSKKIKDNDVDIQKIRNKIQKLQLRQCYEQFHRWSKIDIQKYRNSKSISDLIQQYKPLCLKSINTEIVQHIAQVTDDFNSGVALINASDFFSFNFSGNIHKMVVNIDGSIQLRRDNFLLIQTIHEFQIVFKSRKTSRQLRELFNILPNINKLVFDFDYKTHSHLSCQAFPLLTKAFQIAQQQVKINIYNARMEVFEDLLEVSKKPNPKRSIELKIQMNPYIQQQTPEHMKSKEWGTKLINNFIKNMGNKISKINLQLPLEVNNKQISEFLLNIDYNLLIDLKMKMKQSNINFDPKSNLEQLLQKIVLKKKLLMGKLLLQKRQKSHPLNKSRLLLESVYRVLF